VNRSTLRHRSWRFAAVLGAGASLVLALGAAASASQVQGSPSPTGRASHSVTARPAPPVPAPGASAADWRQWSAAQKAWMESTKWRPAPGCKIFSVAYFAAPARLGTPWAPSWATTTSAAVTGHCATGATAGPLDDSGGAPLPSACKTITGPGSDCVGASSDNERYAKYTYKGTTHTYGSEEISQEASGSCHPGSDDGDTPPTTLTKGGSEEIKYGPVNYSAQWVASWFADGGTTNWGNVCLQI
jgi:hypothetical protein